jgi:hypothetical protein
LALTSVTPMTAGGKGAFVGPGLGRDSAVFAEAARIRTAVNASAVKIERAVRARTIVGEFDVCTTPNGKKTPFMTSAGEPPL